VDLNSYGHPPGGRSLNVRYCRIPRSPVCIAYGANKTIRDGHSILERARIGLTTRYLHLQVDNVDVAVSEMPAPIVPASITLGVGESE
jgi:hypothetical protein